MDKVAGQNEILRYFHALLRRKWLVVVPTVLVGLIVMIVAIELPDSFQSKTMILVTPQKVPEKIVASTVTTDLQDRLTTITQQILSRTALESVIRELGLFAEEKRKKKAPEEIIELMRKRISIRLEGDANRRDRQSEAFEVAYVDANPRTAQAVTSRLAGLFIDENLKVREQQAAGTSQFLADEIERYKSAVADKERAIFDFKRQNMNELADQQASNQARLNQLQSQLQINSQAINSAKDRKVILQQQMGEMEKRAQEDRDRLLSGGDLGGGSSDSRQSMSAEAELAARREELARVRLSLKERHPDVVLLASRIKQLEQQLAREGAGEAAGETAATGGAAAAAPGRKGPPLRYPPLYDQLKLDLQRAEVEIARMTRENEQIQKTIELYQGRLGATPVREMQMKQLSEGYNNVKTVLDSLTDKKIQADLSENMERKQKGEQFRVLDPANVPEKPISPDRLRIVGAGFAGGFGVGVGLVFLIDFLLPGIRSREDLAAAVDVPVLGVIPEIVTTGDLLRRRKVRLWSSGAVSLVAVVSLLIVHLAVKPLPRLLGDFYGRARNTYWIAADTK